MTTEEKKILEEKIRKKLDRQQKHVDELVELTQPIAPENAIGRISRMDAINNKSVNEAALRTAREKLKGLQEALENINKPDFGLCMSCGGDIPIQRMMIMPESKKCVKCATRR